MTGKKGPVERKKPGDKEKPMLEGTIRQLAIRKGREGKSDQKRKKRRGMGVCRRTKKKLMRPIRGFGSCRNTPRDRILKGATSKGRTSDIPKYKANKT